jgi:hypothetical protein
METKTESGDAAPTLIRPPAPKVTATAAPIAAHLDRHTAVRTCWPFFMSFSVLDASTVR